MFRENLAVHKRFILYRSYNDTVNVYSLKEVATSDLCTSVPCPWVDIHTRVQPGRFPTVQSRGGDGDDVGGR
jgi:hypothetical protein